MDPYTALLELTEREHALVVAGSWEELASVSSVAVKLLRGTHRRDRNISHHRLIAAYADWILGRANYPLSFEAVLPTLRLLAEIEREVPTYRAASSAAASRS